MKKKTVDKVSTDTSDKNQMTQFIIGLQKLMFDHDVYFLADGKDILIESRGGITLHLITTSKKYQTVIDASFLNDLRAELALMT